MVMNACFCSGLQSTSCSSSWRVLAYTCSRKSRSADAAGRRHRSTAGCAVSAVELSGLLSEGWGSDARMLIYGAPAASVCGLEGKRVLPTADLRIKDPLPGGDVQNRP